MIEVIRILCFKGRSNGNIFMHYIKQIEYSGNQNYIMPLGDLETVLFSLSFASGK